MKKKLNQLTLFGTVLVLFILHSCTKDDFIETNHHSQANNKRTAFEKKIPFSEVNLDSKMLGNIKISSENQNVVMRTSSEYNTIVIDTTQVSYIERGAYHSYTFLVKNNESENITENLVLSSKADGTYSTALFRYNLTEQDKINISNDIGIDYTGKLEVVNLEASSQSQTVYSYTSSSSCFGEVQIYVSCCSGEHYYGQSCNYDGSDCAPKAPYTAVVISDDCFEGGGIGDGSSPGTGIGDGGNGPGGGSGNGNSTNPNIPNNPDNPNNNNNNQNPETDFGDVITTPLLDANPPVEEEDDCNTSKEDLKKIFPNADDSDMETLASVINKYGKDLGINTKEKLQHFLAQVGHEVGGFSNGIGREENLNYSESRLKKVFKKYFKQSETDTLETKREASDYANNPSALANYVYCCRMGNGNEESGDGYKYRGRGIIQLTGKTNYSDFKNWYNSKYGYDKNFVTNPELLKNNDTVAILSALWFYKKRVLDKTTVDSTTTVKNITKRVNGGTNGLTDRTSRFQQAKDSINCL